MVRGIAINATYRGKTVESAAWPGPDQTICTRE